MTAVDPIPRRAPHALVRAFTLATVVALLASTAAGIADAQTVAAAARDSTPAPAMPAYRYRLLGVYDESTGDPVEGVQVQDILSGLSMRTSATGTVSLVFLPPGGSIVRLRKLGYEEQTFFIAIAPADTTPVTVTMRSAVMLPTVHVIDSASGAATLREAETRERAAHGGYFVGEAEMRKLDNTTLTHALLSRLPGMMLTLGPHGEEYVVSARRPCSGLALAGCQQRCFVGLFVDGVPYSSGSGPIDFSRWSTQEFAMAEFYPDQESTPFQFRSGASPCGVLLLWTRAR